MAIKMMRILSAILCASSCALAGGPKVDTATAEVRFETEGLGEEVFDFLLSEPMSMEDLAGVYVGALVVGMESTQGSWRVTTTVSLLSHGDEVTYVGYTESNGSSSWAWTSRMANFASDRGVPVTALRIRHNRIERNAGFTDLRTRVRGLHDEDRVQVHFVRGSIARFHTSRSIQFPTLELIGAGSSPWWETHFEPVPARHLKFFFLTQHQVSRVAARPGAMTEAEFILDDGSYLRMDDAFSPPTGETEPGRFSAGHALLLDEDARSRLIDREIVGWRRRLVHGGEGTSTIPAASAELFFLRDFEDCDEDGQADFDEIESDPAADSDANGILDRCESVPGQVFRRGDTNGDGTKDISDPIALLAFKFLGGDAPGCEDAADSNDDGLLDVSDAVATLSFLFIGGVSIPAPMDSCGRDPTEDALGCGRFEPCEGS